MHRQLIPRHRGQLPLAHQSAIIAAGLPSIAVSIALVETQLRVSAWTWVSVPVAIVASTTLPFLVAVRPRLSVLLGTVAAALSPGAVPVLVLVGSLGLRIGPRRPPWLVVPLIGVGIAMGFAARSVTGAAVVVVPTLAASVLGVCMVVVGIHFILRPRGAQGVTPQVDSDWLSRRIHDGVGHRLALLSLRARIQQSELPGAGPELWEVVADEVERTFEELRQLLDEIDQRRSPEEDPGFALDAFVVDARRAGVPVLVSGRHLLDRVPSSDAALAAAVVREGIANAAKYGGPGHVHVRFDHQAPGDLTVEVRSPLGVEAPQLSGGRHGLGWLQRQVDQAGGGMRAVIDAEQFVLSARIPVHSQAAAPAADSVLPWSSRVVTG